MVSCLGVDTQRERVSYMNDNSIELLKHQQASNKALEGLKEVKVQLTATSFHFHRGRETHGNTAAQGQESAGNHCHLYTSPSASKQIKWLEKAEGVTKKTCIWGPPESACRLQKKLQMIVLLICLPDLTLMHLTMESKTRGTSAGRTVWHTQIQIFIFRDRGDTREGSVKGTDC